MNSKPNALHGHEAESTFTLSYAPIVFSCFLLLFSFCPADAQLLDYGNYSGYGLKKGILGNDYAHPLAACITGTESTLPASQAAVRASIVYNADEYKNAFHIDQKAEVSFLGYGSGDDELHFGQENVGNSSAFDIIVEAYGEHDGVTIDNVKWDAPYRTLIDSGNPVNIQRVRDACGDRYIQTVFKQTRLFVVLHVSKQMTSSLTAFSFNSHGSMNIDIVTASASLGGDSNVSSAHKAGALSLQVYSEGLGGVIPTAAAIGIVDADGLDAIATRLATYLSGLHDTGQPVKYQLAAFPDLPSGDLSQQQMFDYLRDLKMRYAGSYVRLQNVTSLLSPWDQRRRILQQPSADQELKSVQGALTQYVNAVAVAHSKCRKALTLGVCTDQTSAVQTLPTRPAAELAPVSMPIMYWYTFAIDGTPVSPGENSRLFSASGQTLIDAARGLKPTASNVDLLALIGNGEYLSMISVPALAPNAGAPPTVVSQGSILGQNLSFPKYWTMPMRDASVVNVLHADLQRPCNILVSGGLNYVQEDCLTTQGRLLRDAALADLALFVSHSWPTPIDFPLSATTTDCFGGTAVLLLGQAHIVLSRGPTVGEVTSRIGLFLPLGNVSFPLIEQEENHTLADWAQLADSRPNALRITQYNAAGISPCNVKIQ